MTHNCRDCGVELNDENWAPSHQKGNHQICKSCHAKQMQRWRKKNPEKAKASWIRACRKKGNLPMSENRKCSSFLGVYIAEGVLSHVFKNVQQMPYGNPGYDFICNKGKKIDVKSSCLNKYGRWHFTIERNTIADYFLCLAFDDRKNLNPLYTWLIPGEKINHLKNATIQPSTVHKWNTYHLDTTKVTACCNMMRSSITPI